MQILKAINLLLAFLLELILFCSVGYYGFTQGKSLATKWLIAISAVAITIVLWGFFAAPKSQTRLSFPSRLVFELTMFLIGALSLYKLNYPIMALLFAMLSVSSVAMAYFFKQ